MAKNSLNYVTKERDKLNKFGKLKGEEVKKLEEKFSRVTLELATLKQASDWRTTIKIAI